MCGGPSQFGRRTRLQKVSNHITAARILLYCASKISYMVTITSQSRLHTHIIIIIIIIIYIYIYLLIGMLFSCNI